MVGDWLSVTVTENVQLELLPEASVAVHTTLVVPFGKLNPDAGTHTIEPPTQLSVKLAVKLTLLVHCPGAALTVMLPGQPGTGRSVSLTVTEKLQFELLPTASVAVHSTLIVPFGKLNPDAGTHRIEPPAQLSVNVARKLTLLVHCPGAALTVMLPGQLGTGRSVSLTVTEKLQLELLPDASVAVHTTLVVPFGKLNPDTGTHTIEPPTQLSVKLAVKLTLLAPWPGAALTVMFPGQPGTGRSVPL